MHANTSSTSTKAFSGKRNLRRAAAAAVALAAFAGIPSPASAGFPGANGKIVFVSERDGNPDIFVMNADGTGQTNLTKNNPGSDLYPAWSPDGKLIAFSSYRPGTQHSDIFIMNADGTGVLQLTYNALFDIQPSWSPTGQIVFASDRTTNAGGVMDFDLVTMNPDGTNQVPVKDDSGDSSEEDPAFSNDGQFLSYTVRGADYGSPTVKVARLDPYGHWDPTDGPNDQNPNWSPNVVAAGEDQVIAFESNRSGNAEIYTSSINGISYPEPNLTKNPAKDTEPAWSPDGTKLAFTSDRKGQQDIFVMNADGKSPVRLTTSPAADYSPDWQPVPQGAPACTITGTAGDDILHGTPLNDVICGLGGNDILYGHGGNDRLLGGAGDDYLYGDQGLDYLNGQAGNDRLYGGYDNDNLYGGDGNDWLEGQAGVDTLSGSAGSDFCTQDLGSATVAC